MPKPRTIAWLDAPHLPLVIEVASLADLELLGAGSPTRGQSRAVASELSAGAIDDLRAALASADADLFFIASPGDFGSGREDVAAVQAARARGARVAILEPIVGSAMDLASAGWLDAQAGAPAADFCRFLPAWRRTPGFEEAAELLQSFGPVRTVSARVFGDIGHGSLGARVFDALAFIHALLGEPETIDAAFVAPAAASGLHALPAESLRRLSGDLTANLRFSDGRAASLTLSDRAGRWCRSADILAHAGRLSLHDDTLEAITTDAPFEPSRRRRKLNAASCAEAVSEQIKRLIDPAEPEPAPMDHAAIFSTAQAALLSARTGQPESPATIRRMAALE